MRLKGKQVKGPNVEVIIFPRLEGELVFKAQAVLDYDDFNLICPRPQPPYITYANGTQGRDVNDAIFQKDLEQFASKRTAYTVIKSLEATEDLVWETVDIKNPETWLNYEKELKDSGLCDAERGRLVLGVLRANSLDEDTLEKARQNFIRGMQKDNPSNV